MGGDVGDGEGEAAPGSDDGERGGWADRTVARVAAGVALGALTGLLATVSAPGHSAALGWLVLVAGVPMLVAAHHVLPTHLAWIATGTGFALGAFGIGHGLFPEGESGLARGTVVAVGGIGVVSGLVDRWVADRIGHRWWAATATTFWAVAAIVRLHLPFAGTAGFLAHHLADHPAVLQPVSVVGTITVEAGIVAVNVALASLVLGRLRHPHFDRGRLVRVGAGLVGGLGLWTAWSLDLLADPPPTLRVAAVQPGASFGSGDSSTPRLEPYGDLTRQAADDGAQLVVWDEMGLDAAPCEAVGAGPAEVEAQLFDLAAETGTHIVVGYWFVDEAGLAHNEAVLVTPEGKCRGPYAKRHPVAWLGEQASPGRDTPVFVTDLGRLGVVICYDLDFTDVSQDLVAAGAQVIAAPSRDWSEVARYHSSPLVFRSIENRVPTVKADSAYDSAVVDPYGRVVESVEESRPSTAVVVADVPLSSAGRTVWNQWALLVELAWLTLAVIVVFAIARPLVRSLRRPTRQSPAASPDPSVPPVEPVVESPVDGQTAG